MQQFSEVVAQVWCCGRAPVGDGRLEVVVDGTLDDRRGVSVLRFPGGGGVVTVTPTHRAALDLPDRIADADLTDRLVAAGISLHDPDLVFFLPSAVHGAVRRAPLPDATRVLTAADADDFARFAAAAPPDDLDEAFVELDHWLVVGTFAGDELVAAASAYPWRDSALADVGVITLPQHRGRGLGRRAVQAINVELLRRDHEPQYRCQVDNLASAALAASAGFVPLGRWETLES